MSYQCCITGKDYYQEIEADAPNEAADLFLDNYVDVDLSQLNGLTIDVLNLDDELFRFEVSVIMEPTVVISPL